MQPDYKLIVDGIDIRPKINGKLIELSLTDNRGMTSDELSITLDDSDGQIQLPRLGASISVSIGFTHNLVHKGLFIADEINHAGPADKLTIKARAADLTNTLKTQKTRSFHQKKLGDILKTIAEEYNLDARVSTELGNIVLNHIDQTTESDAHFITRMATEYDALASIKDGNLLFIPNGKSQTATGKPLPNITITRSQGDNHNYNENEREKYTGIKANWQNPQTGNLESVLAGTEGTVKTITKTYPTKQQAIDAAKAELTRTQRGKAQMSLTLAIGKPELITESPVTLIGFKPQIDNQQWVIKQITHTLNDSGLTSGIQLENR